MSYGVIAWKSGQVQVEEVRSSTDPTHDPLREKYRAKVPAAWRSGRVTLTQLSLAFVPSAASGAQSLTLDLADVTAVEATAGRFGRVVSFRTPTAVVHLRASGSMVFAKHVAVAVEARKTRLAAQAETRARRTTRP